MKKTQEERPRHLTVIGTRIKPPVQNNQLRDLLAEVPIEWNFDTPEGEALLKYMKEMVERGDSPEDVAAMAGMDELAAVYRVWDHDHE